MKKDDLKRAAQLILGAIGEDPERGGVAETPDRFARACTEWFSGYGADPAAVLKTFEDGAQSYDELVLVRDIPVWSFCEHHMAPFFGTAVIGYIPAGRVLGLSKFARLTDIFARRLQVQERLTVQIATALNDALKPKGVGVIIRCRHLCMESRGVNKSGATTVTSSLMGVLREDPRARSEFLSIAGA